MSAFSADELRRFITFTIGRDFADSLPAPPTSLATLASEAADKLIRQLRQIGVTEGSTLVVHSSWLPHNGFRGKPADLVGKKVAVPYVSTTHYSLLAALKHWKVDANKVNVINLRPSEIAAAWQRGDIDGAYVWAPAVNELEKDGTVLTDSEKVGQWGAPTLDVWVVRKDFAEKHPEVVKAFAKSAIDADRKSVV